MAALGGATTQQKTPAEMPKRKLSKRKCGCDQAAIHARREHRQGAVLLARADEVIE
jgi:hypothetical protein